MRPTVRRCWLLAHRWLGLTLGLLLLLSALTGSVLTIARPLDVLLHPELFEAPAGAGTASLESVLQALRKEFGPRTAFTFRPPRAAGESLQVFVHGRWDGTVYFDPTRGTELGRRGERDGFVNFVFALHSTLLLEERGRALLATAAFGYLTMLVSGWVLWWPARWRRAWSVKTNGGATRALFDLHRVGGALVGAAVLVAVASGAYMAWRPLSSWVTAASGRAPALPPTIGVATASARVPLDTAVARASAAFPSGRIGYIQVPAGAQMPLRVRLRLSDDPHPNGLSSVWLHPVTGELLATHRWSELDPGSRAFAYVYPLHIGALGGNVTRVTTFLSGATLTGFGVSGLWLWWRRRRVRTRLRTPMPPRDVDMPTRLARAVASSDRSAVRTDRKP